MISYDYTFLINAVSWRCVEYLTRLEDDFITLLCLLLFGIKVLFMP